MVIDITQMMEQTRGEDESLGTAPAILLAKAGDRAAFDRLMIEHHQRVVSLAWRILGNREDALDAAQEAFLRVYRHLHKYDESREFGAWLYSIVVNVCRDQAKKRAGKTTLALDEIAEPRSSHDTESAAIRAQQEALIMKALSTLPEKERLAIVLRDLEGMDTEEVARILGSSPTTVRSQISAARSKIRAFRERMLKRGPL
ncbi:MAG: RNA polymerase sigma factor [Acidobacteriota bacterium]|nr:MAG: RNA polymerase sigma factor [Acidobacteriota bacterium]